MRQQERWDVALVILSGPLRSPQEHIYRGPIVRIGHNPGPGGVQLAGYRGLDARQCTITAYEGGSAEIAPVGRNQVRVAPHAHVNWNNIDPVSSPVFLSKGCAIHIGPVGRGATLQFVECRRLGVWEGGEIRSEVVGNGAGQMGGYGQGIGQGAIPSAYDPRKVGKVSTRFAPAWFLGCTSLIAMFTVTFIVLTATFVFVGDRQVTDIGPISDEYEYVTFAIDLAEPPSAKLLEGLHQPLYHFVMRPNLVAAQGNHDELEIPEKWDKYFVQYVAKSVELHARQRKFWGNLDRKREEWASVVKELRRAELPEVFGAIPYQESRYDNTARSYVCALGSWQFMPETANRVDKHYNTEFRVRNCRLQGRSVTWSPTALTPPFTRSSPYVEGMNCLITSCEIDDRRDLRKSTAGAILTLREAWDSPVIQNSGAAVQATILSHNAGADDEPFGKKSTTNVIPAMKRWISRVGPDEAANFYGQNILCESNHGGDTCGSLLMPETQHYAYNIVAQHILAVCYYAKEYGHMSEFAPWATWSLDDSYCKHIKVPSKNEARTW